MVGNIFAVENFPLVCKRFKSGNDLPGFTVLGGEAEGMNRGGKEDLI